MTLRNHTVNEGDQQTSGTSFKRTSTKKQKQPLTLRLQNSIIKECRADNNFRECFKTKKFP